MSLQISHEAWSIIELSVVHQDKAGEFVTAPSMSDEAENVDNLHPFFVSPGLTGGRFWIGMGIST